MDRDRPTCKTCPYWEPRDDGDGSCHRRAPTPLPLEINKINADYDLARWGSLSEGVTFPAMLATDWCGEHPDFPAYLAARRGPGDVAR